MKKNKEKNYYGIRFNEDIPKIDKINDYSKEVEIKFLGKAFLVLRKDDNTIEKIEIENYYKLEKEGKYEIEFINKKNETYNLQVRIKKSCLLFILLLLLGILLLILFFNPINNENSLLNRFFSTIDLSIISLDIEEKEKPNYVFNVDFKNLKNSSEDMSLQDSLNAKSVAKNKIAPGVNGEFSIIISTKNSSVDMKYTVNFENITNEKPSNLLFKIKGQDTEYSSLQELEKELIGTAKRHTEKEIVIEWKWPYERNNEQDLVDTTDGKILESYKFKINVNGEEVI